MGDILGKRFVLEETLGQGASGTVFAAYDSSVGQRVAIKVLHPELREERARERLRREVRACRPGHRNAVRVYDLHETDGHIYLSLELIDGENLRNRLMRQRELGVEETISIAAQIAAALENLHVSGVVHRDVKPGNILVANDGTVKLCDMGLARPLETGVTITESQMVVGTPGYMAPEQAVGELTPASDVYALGLTLYRCLTGEVPLAETTALATLYRRQRQRPPSIRHRRSDCPRWLDRLIVCMLEPLQKHRPSARELVIHLEKKRFRAKPKASTIVALVSALCLFALGLAGARMFLRPATVTVETTRNRVIGRTRSGGISWQREFPLKVGQDLRHDLDRDGSDELILILAGDPESSDEAPLRSGPEVHILDQEGREWTHFSPEQEADWQFPFSRELNAVSRAIDVDLDGRDEVVLVCNHLNYYPSLVFLYWPKTSQWEQVLSHSGYLYDIAPLSPEEGPGLRFFAVNNLLGVQFFIGDFLVVPDASSANLTGVRYLQAPPESRLELGSKYGWLNYVPVPGGSPEDLIREIVEVPGADHRAGVGPGPAPVLDPFLNPIGGPNEGRDLRELRRRFMNVIVELSASHQPVDLDNVMALRRQSVRELGDVLVEPTYRVMFDLASARAAARCDGGGAAAREMLGESACLNASQDCAYQLAQLEAIDGLTGMAVEHLDRMMTMQSPNTRSNHDGPYLRLRIGIKSRDARQVELAINKLGGVTGGSFTKRQSVSVLNSEVRLWWDQLQPQDVAIHSAPYAPQGDAVACLARWRLGQGNNDDESAMRRAAAEYPDAGVEARLALAAVLISHRNADASIRLLSSLIEELDINARTDFSMTLFHELARALRVAAIDASGDHDLALATAAGLRPTLTPGLLPRILVDDVIARASKPR